MISRYIQQRVRLRLAYIGGLLPHCRGWLDIQISLYESCQSHNGNDNGRSTTFSTLAADTMMLLPHYTALHCTVRPASCNTNPQLTNTAFLSLSTQVEKVYIHNWNTWVFLFPLKLFVISVVNQIEIGF